MNEVTEADQPGEEVPTRVSWWWYIVGIIVTYVLAWYFPGLRGWLMM